MSLFPNTVVNGNCLEVMKEINDASIDMILCDLPYGATQNSWDSVIPPAPLWEQYERIIKPNGAILLFGQDKFTATMMLSNPKLHRYNIIWDKVLKSGFLNAKKMPLREHEDINEPPADVVPVRYGQWILQGHKILCSKCRAVFEELKEEELFEVKVNLSYLCEIEKFCFNCGAKMVKEAQSNDQRKGYPLLGEV